MMKSWSRLCFLVLAVSSLSRGQNETTGDPPQSGERNGETVSDTDPAKTSTPRPADANHSEPVTPPPQNQTATNQTGPSTTAFKTQAGTTVATAVENNGSAAAQTTASGGVSGSGGKGDDAGVTTTVSTETTSSSVIEDKDQSDHSSWGYVILVLIILVIIALCVILYILRRVSRTYSFDLQRPAPVSHLSEPTGTFEPVYLDDLDRPAPKDQTTPDDLSPPPVSNGTTLPSEEKGSGGENGTTSDAPQEQPDANGLETSNASPSLGDEAADKTSSPLSSANLFFDTIGEEQQNENNNNPSVCSSDPFVEINLDDPAWCDQLLTSPEAPSSVLPFSPFSFSSSSSSSSS